MNKINIRCCSKTIEKSLDIHFCDYAIITMLRYCFVMLISKHNIIVKQSKFAREPSSRLLKIIVVKILTTLKFYIQLKLSNKKFNEIQSKKKKFHENFDQKKKEYFKCSKSIFFMNKKINRKSTKDKFYEILSFFSYVKV